MSGYAFLLPPLFRLLGLSQFDHLGNLRSEGPTRAQCLFHLLL